ncbi:type II toxin-antitoxin system Phd/YefM family antitoxin [Hydrogenophaga atypica]|uniref:Antitoxin n=1 Tax=Hydrogenophaga atypica TaxID=249409 RepID=A0ABW2QJJ3_9BURK
MQHMTSSQAKQNFGELLDAAAQGPVAIERHRKVKAIVCSPEAFLARTNSDSRLAERRAARADQALVEKDRLIKHQALAIQLLLMPAADSQALVTRAQQEVTRWRRERLCSLDYIERWEALLQRSVNELAQAMGSETLEWGTALRQNSPWHVVMA